MLILLSSQSPHGHYNLLKNSKVNFENCNFTLLPLTFSSCIMWKILQKSTDHICIYYVFDDPSSFGPNGINLHLKIFIAYYKLLVQNQ